MLIKYVYNRHYLDGLGIDSTFHRWATWLRIARDEALGVETEKAPDFVPLLQKVNNAQLLQKMQELDYLFDDSLSDAEFARRHREYKKGLAA